MDRYVHPFTRPEHALSDLKVLKHFVITCSRDVVSACCSTLQSVLKGPGRMQKRARDRRDQCPPVRMSFFEILSSHGPSDRGNALVQAEKR